MIEQAALRYGLPLLRQWDDELQFEWRPGRAICVHFYNKPDLGEEEED